MKYFLTLLLIAIAPVKALADGKLIEAPVAPTFDIKDLEQRSEKSKEVKSGWSEYQAKMDEAFEKTVSFMAAESEVDIAIAAGERFLQAFGGNNNPYSTEDDEQIAEVKKLVEALTKPSIVSLVPQSVEDDDSELVAPQSVALARVDLFSEDDWRAVVDALALAEGVECPFVPQACIRESGITLFPDPLVFDKNLRLEPSLILSEGVWVISSVGEVKQMEEPYSGVAKAYNSFGVRVWDLTFFKGQLEGPASRFYPSGQKSLQLAFRKGEVDGKRDEWHQDGSRKSSSFYKDGVPRKKFTKWDEFGQLRVSSKFTNSSKGALNGISEAWHENGKLAFKGRFEIGKIFGTHKIFYLNGNPKLEYKLIPDVIGDCVREPSISDLRQRRSRLEAPAIERRIELERQRGGDSCTVRAIMPIYKVASEWDEKGNLLWKSKKNFFQQWGDAQQLIVDFSKRKNRHFYESGALKSVVSYNRLYSALDGELSLFYENGKRRLSGEFASGKRVGKWKKFDPNGALIKQVCFADKPPERRVVCS